ncbi:fungal-specific transcription factor domain-containing protein [Aspergillus alliaceus]|uniref:Fungal-specific transcription factor domain-containing protein n=1 Tax=Petromyces alliaceus TaxID=209559 RepID=A0A5N7BTS7_PETAA|nr:fungal-specific transcription factor domain-containing protein [Aspergillus alliaceus]
MLRGQAMMASTTDTAATNNSLRPRLAKTVRRRRSVRPCDLCRVRKSRCVMLPGSPCCTVCQSRQTACTFNQKPPPRPSRTQARMQHDVQQQSSENDTRSGQVYRSLAPSTRVSQQVLVQHRVGMDRTAVTQPPASSSPPGHPSSLVPENLIGDCYLVVQNPQSMLPTNTSQSNEDNDGSLGLSKSKFAELYGLTSDMEPILMRHRPYDNQTHEYQLETHSIRRVLHHDMGMQYPVTFHIVSDDKAIGYQYHIEQDMIERCVAPYGSSLVDLFWRIVHPCYPILNKGKFMERYSISYREIEASILGAIYLISLNWWTYDRELNNKPAPNETLLRERVIQAIQNSYHRPKLSSIEATLLLVQCKPEDALNPDHTWTWGYTSQALSIGEALGLHLDASSWEIPEWERGLRKRLSWAMYMQDKWTALMHGRPSHIHDDNWGVKDIDDSDLYDVDDNMNPKNDEVPMNDIQTGRRGFVEMITLSKSLSKILTEFFSLRASKTQDTVELYHRAIPILEKLHIWRVNIPHSLLMDRQIPRRLCANGLLYCSDATFQS